MKTSQLFRHSRLRLAFWYALVMGVILSLSGFEIDEWVGWEKKLIVGLDDQTDEYSKYCDH